MNEKKVTFKHVRVNRSVVHGGDNVFQIIGTIRGLINHTNGAAAAREWVEAATSQQSYEEVLSFCERTVTVR